MKRQKFYNTHLRKMAILMAQNNQTIQKHYVFYFGIITANQF